MDNEIDYKALAEGLMNDLENSRIEFMKVKHELDMAPRRVNISMGILKSFIQQNYIVLMFALFAAHTLFSMFIEFFNALDWRKKHV